MGADTVIDLDCAPKQALTTVGLLSRLKARARAELILKLYRDQGDTRAPAQMGVEVVTRDLDGNEQTETIVVQQLFDELAVLGDFAAACVGCPANLGKGSFGCYGTVNYPISAVAEHWLLDRLPAVTDPLPYLLLKQTIEEWPNPGVAAAPIRRSPGVIVESAEVATRRIGEIRLNANFMFEMIFMRPAINPLYATMLLLLFGVITRDLEIDEIRQLVPAPPDYLIRYPCLLVPEPDDDESIDALKRLLYALYTAWGLNVPLSLDA